MFNKKIKIGNRYIGEGYPTYIIAEIGANFDNDINKAKQLIKAAKDAGADCAKFQSFLSHKIVSDTGFKSMKLKGVHGTWNKPVSKVFKEAEFNREWHKELFDYCNEIGIDFSTSPYDFEAVDICEKLNVPFIKIGSGDITWLEMIEYIANKQIPIFIATGDATLSEIDEVIQTIKKTNNNNVVLMQCITNYPSKIESANINVLKTYNTAFNILTGYSDHSPGLVVALGSVALGACVIEKHFTLNKSDIGPDHNHSMNISEFSEMVKCIRELESALGSTIKNVVEEESETVIVQRRSLYTTKDLKQGHILTNDDIIELRPALSIPPKYKNIIIGKPINKNLKYDSPIKWTDI